MIRTGRALVGFIATGTATVLVDVAVLYSAHSLVGMPLAAATAMGFGVSTVLNFLGHRTWAGGDASAQLAHHAGRYTVLLLLNLMVTLLVVTSLAALGLNYLVAKSIAILVTSIVSFVSYPRWVFV